MNCKKCGSQLEPNAKFCMTCGEKVEELNNQEVAAQSPQPILPDAPEAPLPGTTNKVTEAPVVMPTTEVQPAAPVAPTPAGPVLPTPMAPVSPTPATPVSPTPAAPVSPTPAAPVAPTTVEPQTSVAPQAQVAPQTPATQPTANKNSNKIVIAIIVVLAIVSGVLLFVLLYGTNGLKNKDKTTTTTTEATTKSTTTTKKLVNEQEINGVLVTIPEGWTYTKVSIVGAILNETGGTQINIYPINDHNFEYYKQNINLVEESLKQSGVQILDRRTGKKGNQEYLLFNCVYKGVDEVMMFTSMPNGNLIRFELFRIDISADEVIDITNSIAASAREKEGGQSFSAGITDHL